TISGMYVWADRYDRELKDLFSVQDEVAHAVAATFAGRVEITALRQQRRKPTENLTAYDCYLRGIEHHQRFTDEDMQRAREFFERAIALDPDFSLPYGWLAVVSIEDWFRTGTKAS